jgi:hypothetical protein
MALFIEEGCITLELKPGFCVHLLMEGMVQLADNNFMVVGTSSYRVEASTQGIASISLNVRSNVSTTHCTPSSIIEI